jgi:dCTP deaminase
VTATVTTEGAGPLPSDSGVLPRESLAKAVETRVIHSRWTIPDRNIQPASVDLRLGEVAHRLRCSFLPGRQTVASRLADYSMGEVSLIGGAVLERNRPYLIPLMEELALPAGIRARANPRSSTGRLDIFTRVVTDRSSRFDDIDAGYAGPIYLEVVSRSFTIKLARESSMNQLRLISGDGFLGDTDLRTAHSEAPLLFRDDEPIPADDLPVRNGLSLSLDLTGDEDGIVGYRAKRNSHLLDLSLVGQHDVADFWEPVTNEPGNRLVLEPEEFYLLLSAESLRVPPNFAGEMIAFDPTSGELRTHYAGFFDPGFGHATQPRGSRATLEVRAHDVPFVVEHGQHVCKLSFERMAAEPGVLYGQEIGSHYQSQEVVLSKHFRPPQRRRGQLELL